MSLRLITSLGGVIAAVGGVSGVAYSLLGSKGVTTNNSLRREQQTENIEVPLSCSREKSGSSAESEGYTFHLQGKINREQLSQLKRDRAVEIKGGFWFLADNDWQAINKLVGEKDVYIYAKYDEGDKLKITFGRGTGRVSESNLTEAVTFYCSPSKSEWSVLKNEDNDSSFFLTKIYFPSPKTIMNHDDTKLKVSVGNCQPANQLENAVCDLQLSIVSGEKSVKVFEKSNFRFSK